MRRPKPEPRPRPWRRHPVRFHLARIFHESACGGPQGVGSEAYLKGTSPGPASEGARKDGHIIRARCAPLSPASGFPVSWSQQVIHEIPGLDIQFSHFQSVALDELPSWLHLVSHKDGKNYIGFNRILYSHLEQGAFLGAHGGLP
jgi:hypothetical protein